MVAAFASKPQDFENNPFIRRKPEQASEASRGFDEFTKKQSQCTRNAPISHHRLRGFDLRLAKNIKNVPTLSEVFQNLYNFEHIQFLYYVQQFS